jgi:hypothetical protein
MAGGEAFKRPATMLSEAAHQVARHADIECAQTITGHDIDTGLAFLGHMTSHIPFGVEASGANGTDLAAPGVSLRAGCRIRSGMTEMCGAACDISRGCRLLGHVREAAETLNDPVWAFPVTLQCFGSRRNVFAPSNR